MITISINRWSSHLNMILYSLLFYSEKCKVKYNIKFDGSAPDSGAILEYNNKMAFLDYSDSPDFLTEPSVYKFYFKRSLLVQDQQRLTNVYPLGFHVNYTYMPLNLLRKINFKHLLSLGNRTEVIRAVDLLGLITNNSHSSMDIRKYPDKIMDNGGRIIYCARLWDTDRVRDVEEKSRRQAMNEFRINACRIIKEKFKDSIAGLSPDYYAKLMAPDILLNNSQITKKGYLRNLSESDICIADDGLKDTLGWKIGEYALFGKAIITTPIKIVLPGFTENINYVSLSSRLAFDEIPQKINEIRMHKDYLRMATANLEYARNYLHPISYIQRILHIMQ